MQVGCKFWRTDMEELRLPSNIKVHFAGCEVQNQFLALKELGVNYGLYTAYPFVERLVFGGAVSPIMPLKWQKENPYKEIPKYIMDNMKHVIQDSGLFTLMFGSQQGKKDETLINKWYDGLVRYTNEYTQGVTMVEVDCQKVLNPSKAWEFRERLRNDCPNNRIINVFHLEDGAKGLDRLIEFSDYIAISVPELRIAGKVSQVPALASYIKRKKPSIDIHLLGCTELKLLRQCRFCTSADSTTWTIGKRYGYIEGKHISSINTEKIKQHYGKDVYQRVQEYNKKEYNTNFLLLQVDKLKHTYEKTCGCQDYKNK